MAFTTLDSLVSCPFCEISASVSRGYHTSIEVVSRQYHLGIGCKVDVANSSSLLVEKLEHCGDGA